MVIQFYMSRRVEATATKTNDAKVVVDFLKSNIFYRFGVPKALISDQGSHFCNRAMSSLLHKYGVVYRIGTTYHPQTNGQAEVFNREMKKTLTRANSLRMPYGHIELHTELRWGCLPTGLSSVKPIIFQWNQEIPCSTDLKERVLSRPESIVVQFMFKAHSSFEPLHDFDLEIDKTLHRVRKASYTVTPNSSSSNSIWDSENSHFTTSESNFSEHQEAGSMENNDRTLKELATPDVVYQPWCIQCPPLEPAQSYELKSSLIHLLPKFHGLAGEDPHKHLKEFHVVCSTMRPQGIPEDHIKMKVFPFSLDGVAKDWLYLQPILFNT
ncbi:gag-pol, partial [Mucuna pruriens]